MQIAQLASASALALTKSGSSATDHSRVKAVQMSLILLLTGLMVAMLSKMMPVYLNTEDLAIEFLVIPSISLMLCGYTLVKVLHGTWHDNRIAQLFCWVQ